MKDFDDMEDLTEEYRPEMFLPERVQQRLKSQGIYVTIDQATEIVELLNHLSNIIVSQKLRQCK